MQETGQDRDEGRSPARGRVAARRRAGLAGPATGSGMAIVMGSPMPEGVEGVTVAGPDDVDAVLLATVGAARVICPLVAEDFDAVAVAVRLAKLGFGGTLYVLAPDLPNPRMVEREIRTQGGGLDVHLVTQPRPAP